MKGVQKLTLGPVKETTTVECKDGKKHGMATRFNRDRKKLYEGRYVDGNLQYTRQWYDNGALKSYGEYGANNQIKYWISWDEQGEPLSEEGMAPTSVPPDVRPLLPKQNLIPSAIIEKGNAYIIEKTGKDYFERNYKLVRSKGYYYNSVRGTEYTLQYEYAPLAKISPDTLVVLHLGPGPDEAMKGFVAVTKPTGKSQKPKVLEPKITKEQAIAISTKSVGSAGGGNVWASLRTPNEYAKEKIWIWEVQFRHFSSAEQRQGTGVQVNVDAMTGEVLSKNDFHVFID
ncbi:MAG: PepSY domain-containing protein [Pseudomonadota bacterium]